MLREEIHLQDDLNFVKFIYGTCDICGHLVVKKDKIKSFEETLKREQLDRKDIGVLGKNIEGEFYHLQMICGSLQTFFHFAQKFYIEKQTENQKDVAAS